MGKNEEFEVVVVNSQAVTAPNNVHLNKKSPQSSLSLYKVPRDYF